MPTRRVTVLCATPAPAAKLGSPAARPPDVEAVYSALGVLTDGQEPAEEKTGDFDQGIAELSGWTPGSSLPTSSASPPKRNTAPGDLAAADAHRRAALQVAAATGPASRLGPGRCWPASPLRNDALAWRTNTSTARLSPPAGCLGTRRRTPPRSGSAGREPALEPEGELKWLDHGGGNDSRPAHRPQPGSPVADKVSLCLPVSRRQVAQLVHRQRRDPPACASTRPTLPRTYGASTAPPRALESV